MSIEISNTGELQGLSGFYTFTITVNCAQYNFTTFLKENTTSICKINYSAKIASTSFKQ